MLCAGENGAGKSTLMKILSGAYRKDSGSIFFNGKEVNIDSTKYSEQLGISIIYQELNQVNGLTVAENIYLGRQPKKKGIIQWKQMFQRRTGAFRQPEDRTECREKTGLLTIAHKTAGGNCKSRLHESQVVIMDEPTSSLTSAETEILFAIIETLRDAGTAVIFISHRMDEIFRICDRLTVLRDGCYIGTKDIRETTKDELIKMMIGRELTQQYPARNVRIGDEILRVERLPMAEKLKKFPFH